MASTALLRPRAEDISLIVSDVDGTLLTSSTHSLHDRTRNAIRSLRKAKPSLPIVIASGKQYNSCEKLRSELELDIDHPALHGHGAIVYGAGGKLISSVGLAKEAIRAVVEGLPHHAVFLFTPDDVYLTQDDGEQDWLELARRYDHNVHDARETGERDDLLARIEGGLAIVKVTIGTMPEEVNGALVTLTSATVLTTIRSDTLAALTTLHSRFPSSPWKCTRAISFILELVPPSINKAVALTKLCASLDIPLSRVMAFGDGDNDAEMLQAVGYGVAMGNAMPLPLSVARYTTLTNDEGGVGAFLEQVYGLE